MREDFLKSVAELRKGRGRKWHTYGADVLPAWIADMDFAPPEAVREAVCAIADTGDYVYESLELRTPVAALFTARMRELFDCDLDESLTLELADVVQGIVTCITAFSEPGDAVATLTPAYPPIYHVIESAGRRLADIPMVAGDSGFTIDWQAVEKQFARRDVTILVLCNPHNPTGRVLTEAELARLLEAAREHDVLVISDEIHADMVYPGQRHIPAASAAPDGLDIVTLYSASKAFNLGGLRCGVMHMGSRSRYDAFLAQVPFRALGRANVIGKDATTSAWLHGAEWQHRVMEQLTANRRRLAEWVADSSAVCRWHEPEGTYLAWLDFSDGLAGRAASAHTFLLDNARVAVSDGSDFGAGYSRWARLNFATAPDILDEILGRITGAFPAR